MATSFSEIYDLALVSIRDYKINQIFENGLEDFENFMLGFLKKAIPKFNNCNTDLEDSLDFENSAFTEILTLKEQVILSNLMIIEWLNSKILDVTQMQLHLNDTDFRHYAEERNLSGKMSAREIFREVISQDMVDYGIKNIPWADWSNGNFGI